MAKLRARSASFVSIGTLRFVAGGFALSFGAGACTEINVLPDDDPAVAETGGTSAMGGAGVPRAGETGSGTGGAAAGSGGSGGRTLTEPDLDQHDRAYEELEEAIEAVGAADANGHVNQLVLAEWARAPGGLTHEHKEFLFDVGDEMSEFQYTVADGVGSLMAPMGAISRFNRAPTGGRFTGPNARACLDCHDKPIGNAGGDAVNNVLQDPEPMVAGSFNLRNTRNVNGDAWIELAAIEMTLELQAQLSQCKSGAQLGQLTTTPLETKGVSFGAVTCELQGAVVRVDYSNIDGISPDLVVRAQGWKGNVPTFRAFGEDAAFGEMGMMSDRFAYVGTTLPSGDLGATSIPDLDGDGVTHEMSVGDITALQFYFAAQSRPTTLVALGEEMPSLLARPLTSSETALIARGEDVFDDIGCATCHVRELAVEDPVFRIPDERVAAFRDVELEATANGYQTTAQVRIDLSSDPVVEPPHIVATGGVYLVAAMTDLKRHHLGNHLCDGPKRSTPIDSSFKAVTPPSDSMLASIDVKITACEFLTGDLWGVAQTPPYLHDGRASTLTEAILAHCSTGEPVSEAQDSCQAFSSASADEKSALIAFLMNQVFRPDDPEPE
jgi:hypothetical protein